MSTFNNYADFQRGRIQFNRIELPLIRIQSVSSSLPNASDYLLNFYADLVNFNRSHNRNEITYTIKEPHRRDSNSTRPVETVRAESQHEGILRRSEETSTAISPTETIVNVQSVVIDRLLQEKIDLYVRLSTQLKNLNRILMLNRGKKPVAN